MKIDKEIDILLSQFFHSITNTISATNNLFYLLDLELIDDQPTRDYLKNISKNIKNTNISLQNIVTWYYLKSDKLLIDFQQLLLNDILDVVIENLHEFAKHKNIEIKNNVKTAIKINSDENLLYLIIYNIIHNAIKFSRENTFINIKNYIQQNSIELKIIDNGIGIEKDIQDKLFKINYIKDVKKIGTKGENGMGLSLFITKKLSEVLNIELLIKSNGNKGTEISLLFPY